MRSVIFDKNALCKFLLAVCIALIATITNAQRYQSGDIGTIGMSEKWNWNSPVSTMDSTDDANSFGFKVYNDLTVDRALLRLTGIDAGTTLRIGIMGDDGSGNPDGTFLASDVIDPPDGDSDEYFVFGSVTLSAGNSYHLVIQPETIGAGESFRVYASSHTNSVRAFDRHPEMPVLYKSNGGSWNNSSRGPFFALGNGSDIGVPGPGQPYKMQYIYRTICQGGTGNSTGQRFMIFDSEIPADGRIEVTNITFSCDRTTGVTNDLLVELREDDLTVLASATVSNADITTSSTPTDHNINWNTPVWLDQGTPYLVTFSFIGERPPSSEYIRIESNFDVDNRSIADCTWGGTNDCVPIKSASSGVWSSYTKGELNADIRFSMSGLVYLEPRGTVISVK